MVYFGCAPGFACFNLMRGKSPGCIARRLEHAMATPGGAPMLTIEDLVTVSKSSLRSLLLDCTLQETLQSY